MKAWGCVAGLALGLGLGLGAGAETRPRYGGTVEASLLGAPVSVDPAAAQTHAEQELAALVFDTLYAVGPDGSARPHLAIGAPISDAQRTTVRIQIPRGVRFHDGSELTATDVAASLERARKLPAGRAALAAIAGIHADGPDAIELALRVAGTDVAPLLALPATAVTKGGRPPAADRPIGSGPFAVDAIDRTARRIALHAFDDHFAGRAYLDALVLRWYDTPDGEARRYETGGAQVSARGATAFASGTPMYRGATIEGPAALLLFVGFGRAHADITGAVAFRRALDLALGRGAVATIGSGERVIATTLPVPVEAGAAPIAAAARAGNVEAAKQALAAIPAGKLANLKLEILVEDTRPDDREVAERVLRALDKLGIAVTITALPATAMRERVARGQTDLYVGQVAEPVASPIAWWAAAFAAGGDDWLERKLAGAPLDPAATGKAFAERLPIVPLAFRAIRLVARTDVRGLGFDGAGRVLFADAFLFGDPQKAKK